MEKELGKKGFNSRAFVSVAMFLSGLCLPISGIMNHRLQFEILSAERHFWMSVHNMAALLFSIFAILHIIKNWRVLVHYAQKARNLSVSKEAVSAFVLVIAIVGLFSLHAFHVN